MRLSPHCEGDRNIRIKIYQRALAGGRALHFSAVSHSHRWCFAAFPEIMGNSITRLLLCAPWKTLPSLHSQSEGNLHALLMQCFGGYGQVLYTDSSWA